MGVRRREVLYLSASPLCGTSAFQEASGSPTLQGKGGDLFWGYQNTLTYLYVLFSKCRGLHEASPPGKTPGK